jgi:hypothetical protein
MLQLCSCCEAVSVAAVLTLCHAVRLCCGRVEGCCGRMNWRLLSSSRRGFGTGGGAL